LIGPAEKLIVVFADLLNRGAAGIVLQQRGVLVFRLLYLSFGLPDQAGQRGLRKGTLPIQATDDFLLVPLLFVLGGFDFFLGGLLFAVQLGVLLADALLDTSVVGFPLNLLEHLIHQIQHDPIHPLGQVQCLPVAGPQALASLVAVVLCLHVFLDAAVRQFVAILVQEGRHLRTTVGTDNDASQQTWVIALFCSVLDRKI